MTLPPVRSNPFSRPDPFSFRKYDYWLHRDGTHGFCIQALWRVGRTDFDWLVRHNKNLEEPFVHMEPNNKFFTIFDVQVKVVPDFEAVVPQLVFNNIKRVNYAR